MVFDFYFENIGTKLHWLYFIITKKLIQITDIVQLNSCDIFYDRVAVIKPSMVNSWNLICLNRKNQKSHPKLIEWLLKYRSFFYLLLSSVAAGLIGWSSAGAVVGKLGT